MAEDKAACAKARSALRVKPITLPYTSKETHDFNSKPNPIVDIAVPASVLLSQIGNTVLFPTAPQKKKKKDEAVVIRGPRNAAYGFQPFYLLQDGALQPATNRDYQMYTGSVDVEDKEAQLLTQLNKLEAAGRCSSADATITLHQVDTRDAGAAGVYEFFMRKQQRPAEINPMDPRNWLLMSRVIVYLDRLIIQSCVSVGSGFTLYSPAAESAELYRWIQRRPGKLSTADAALQQLNIARAELYLSYANGLPVGSEREWIVQSEDLSEDKARGLSLALIGAHQDSRGNVVFGDTKLPTATTELLVTAEQRAAQMLAQSWLDSRDLLFAHGYQLIDYLNLVMEYMEAYPPQQPRAQPEFQFLDQADFVERDSSYSVRTALRERDEGVYVLQRMVRGGGESKSWNTAAVYNVTVLKPESMQAPKLSAAPLLLTADSPGGDRRTSLVFGWYKVPLPDVPQDVCGPLSRALLLWSYEDADADVKEKEKEKAVAKKLDSVGDNPLQLRFEVSTPDISGQYTALATEQPEGTDPSRRKKGLSTAVWVLHQPKGDTLNVTRQAGGFDKPGGGRAVLQTLLRIHLLNAAEGNTATGQVPLHAHIVESYAGDTMQRAKEAPYLAAARSYYGGERSARSKSATVSNKIPVAQELTRVAYAADGSAVHRLSDPKTAEKPNPKMAEELKKIVPQGEVLKETIFNAVANQVNWEMIRNSVTGLGYAWLIFREAYAAYDQTRMTPINSFVKQYVLKDLPELDAVLHLIYDSAQKSELSAEWDKNGELAWDYVPEQDPFLGQLPRSSLANHIVNVRNVVQHRDIIQGQDFCLDGGSYVFESPLREAVSTRTWYTPRSKSVPWATATTIWCGRMATAKDAGLYVLRVDLKGEEEEEGSYLVEFDIAIRAQLLPSARTQLLSEFVGSPRSYPITRDFIRLMSAPRYPSTLVRFLGTTLASVARSRAHPGQKEFSMRLVGSLASEALFGNRETNLPSTSHYHDRIGKLLVSADPALRAVNMFAVPYIARALFSQERNRNFTLGLGKQYATTSDAFKHDVQRAASLALQLSHTLSKMDYYEDSMNEYLVVDAALMFEAADSALTHLNANQQNAFRGVAQAADWLADSGVLFEKQPAEAVAQLTAVVRALDSIEDESTRASLEAWLHVDLATKAAELVELHQSLSMYGNYDSLNNLQNATLLKPVKEHRGVKSTLKVGNPVESVYETKEERTVLELLDGSMHVLVGLSAEWLKYVDSVEKQTQDSNERVRAAALAKMGILKRETADFSGGKSSDPVSVATYIDDTVPENDSPTDTFLTAAIGQPIDETEIIVNEINPPTADQAYLALKWASLTERIERAPMIADVLTNLAKLTELSELTKGKPTLEKSNLNVAELLSADRARLIVNKLTDYFTRNYAWPLQAIDAIADAIYENVLGSLPLTPLTTVRSTADMQRLLLDPDDFYHFRLCMTDDIEPQPEFVSENFKLYAAAEGFAAVLTTPLVDTIQYLESQSAVDEQRKRAASHMELKLGALKGVAQRANFRSTAPGQLVDEAGGFDYDNMLFTFTPNDIDNMRLLPVSTEDAQFIENFWVIPVPTAAREPDVDLIWKEVNVPPLQPLQAQRLVDSLQKESAAELASLIGAPVEKPSLVVSSLGDKLAVSAPEGQQFRVSSKNACLHDKDPKVVGKQQYTRDADGNKYPFPRVQNTGAELGHSSFIGNPFVIIDDKEVEVCPYKPRSTPQTDGGVTNNGSDGSKQVVDNKGNSTTTTSSNTVVKTYTNGDITISTPGGGRVNIDSDGNVIAKPDSTTSVTVTPETGDISVDQPEQGVRTVVDPQTGEASVRLPDDSTIITQSDGSQIHFDPQTGTSTKSEPVNGGDGEDDEDITPLPPPTSFPSGSVTTPDPQTRELVHVTPQQIEVISTPEGGTAVYIPENPSGVNVGPSGDVSIALLPGGRMEFDKSGHVKVIAQSGDVVDVGPGGAVKIETPKKTGVIMSISAPDPERALLESPAPSAAVLEAIKSLGITSVKPVAPQTGELVKPGELSKLLDSVIPGKRVDAKGVGGLGKLPLLTSVLPVAKLVADAIVKDGKELPPLDSILPSGPVDVKKIVEQPTLPPLDDVPPSGPVDVKKTVASMPLLDTIFPGKRVEVRAAVASLPLNFIDLPPSKRAEVVAQNVILPLTLPSLQTPLPSGKLDAGARVEDPVAARAELIRMGGIPLKDGSVLPGVAQRAVVTGPNVSAVLPALAKTVPLSRKLQVAAFNKNADERLPAQLDVLKAAYLKVTAQAHDEDKPVLQAAERALIGAVDPAVPINAVRKDFLNKTLTEPLLSKRTQLKAEVRDGKITPVEANKQLAATFNKAVSTYQAVFIPVAKKVSAAAAAGDPAQFCQDLIALVKSELSAEIIAADAAMKLDVKLGAGVSGLSSAGVQLFKAEDSSKQQPLELAEINARIGESAESLYDQEDNAAAFKGGVKRLLERSAEKLVKCFSEADFDRFRNDPQFRESTLQSAKKELKSRLQSVYDDTWSRLDSDKYLKDGSVVVQYYSQPGKPIAATENEIKHARYVHENSTLGADDPRQLRLGQQIDMAAQTHKIRLDAVNCREMKMPNTVGASSINLAGLFKYVGELFQGGSGIDPQSVADVKEEGLSEPELEKVEQWQADNRYAELLDSILSALADMTDDAQLEAPIKELRDQLAEGVAGSSVDAPFDATTLAPAFNESVRGSTPAIHVQKYADAEKPVLDGMKAQAAARKATALDELERKAREGVFPAAEVEAARERVQNTAYDPLEGVQEKLQQAFYGGDQESLLRGNLETDTPKAESWYFWSAAGPRITELLNPIPDYSAELDARGDCGPLQAAANEAALQATPVFKAAAQRGLIGSQRAAYQKDGSKACNSSFPPGALLGTPAWDTLNSRCSGPRQCYNDKDLSNLMGSYETTRAVVGDDVSAGAVAAGADAMYNSVSSSSSSPTNGGNNILGEQGAAALRSAYATTSIGGCSSSNVTEYLSALFDTDFLSVHFREGEDGDKVITRVQRPVSLNITELDTDADGCKQDSSERVPRILRNVLHDHSRVLLSRGPVWTAYVSQGAGTNWYRIGSAGKNEVVGPLSRAAVFRALTEALLSSSPTEDVLVSFEAPYRRSSLDPRYSELAAETEAADKQRGRAQLLMKKTLVHAAALSAKQTASTYSKLQQLEKDYTSGKSGLPSPNPLQQIARIDGLKDLENINLADAEALAATLRRLESDVTELAAKSPPAGRVRSALRPSSKVSTRANNVVNSVREIFKLAAA